MAEAMLKALAWVGHSGPVIMLAGEADIACAEELSALISAQLAGGAQQLTIDASRLRFADSSAIRTLVLAARTLRERGGRLVLLNPQQAVRRVLTLLGADQMFAILERPERRSPSRLDAAEDTLFAVAPGISQSFIPD